MNMNRIVDASKLHQVWCQGQDVKCVDGQVRIHLEMCYLVPRQDQQAAHEAMELETAAFRSYFEQVKPVH